MSETVSKFYAQSGEFRWVFLSKSLEDAALRFIQLALQDVVKSKQAITTDLSLIDSDLLESKKSLLGEKVLISESGFEGIKTGVFDTTVVIAHWQNQIKSVEDMLRKMA